MFKDANGNIRTEKYSDKNITLMDWAQKHKWAWHKIVGEIENRSVEIIPPGKEREKKDLKLMNRASATCRRTSRKGSVLNNIVQETMTKNFLNLVNCINLQIQKAEQTQTG